MGPGAKKGVELDFLICLRSQDSQPGLHRIFGLGIRDSDKLVIHKSLDGSRDNLRSFKRLRTVVLLLMIHSLHLIGMLCFNFYDPPKADLVRIIIIIMIVSQQGVYVVTDTNIQQQSERQPEQELVCWDIRWPA